MAGINPIAWSAIQRLEVVEMVPEEAVRQRSYEIWQREGRPEGKALEHWLQAQSELEAERRRREFRVEYHTILYRLDERQRVVVPRPRICAPPKKFVAQRVPRGEQPAAA
jgi:hypothetical protein